MTETGKHNGMNTEAGRKGKFYIVCFVILWVVQMAAAFYFCMQKKGFHEDEYYTYYSTARTSGFYVEDGQWMERETYRNEFVVLPGEQFQYGLVKQVQSWDVHPPLYYWVFHTAASLVPGVFSKWIGLSVNLFFHGINLILLTHLSYLVSNRNKALTLMVTLFYGLTPAAISGVVFIRMYEMLTMWALMCAALHVKEVKRREEAGWESHARSHAPKLPVRSFLVPTALVTYLGFLTQYYYFIFLFFMGAGFCLYLLWRDRSIRNCLRYGLSQMIALVLAYLTYPSCLGQMFRGQRGAQATENFMELSNTWERLCFFYDLLDGYVFGKMLTWILLLTAVLAVTAYGAAGRRRLSESDRSKRNGQTSDARQNGQTAVGEKRAGKADFAYWLLVCAAGGYFLTVSKTALLLGDTSNRYQLPVYGMIVLLLFEGIRRLTKMCVSAVKEDQLQRIVSGERNERQQKGTLSDGDRTGTSETGGNEPGTAGSKTRCLGVAVVLLCLIVDISGLAGGRVVFLYPEDEQQTAFAAERAEADTPVVYVYQPGADWCIWDVTNELLEYPAVYFVAAGSEYPVEDERITGARELVVYLADGVDAEAELARLGVSISDTAEEWEPVYTEKYCSVYDIR